MPSFAIADRMARQRLQFQGDVLQDVGRVSAAVQALKKATALTDTATMLNHAGQPGLELFVKTRDLLR